MYKLSTGPKQLSPKMIQNLKFFTSQAQLFCLLLRRVHILFATTHPNSPTGCACTFLELLRPTCNRLIWESHAFISKSTCNKDTLC